MVQALPELNRLLSKDVRIKIYQNKILLTILHGRETWSLVLSVEHG
jgi:hypothetical protein